MGAGGWGCSALGVGRIGSQDLDPDSISYFGSSAGAMFGTMFAALIGSSMANTAMLGSLLVPEMQRRGYSARMSMGPILGTGGLAMIIPPSSLGVLLASIGNIDVG